MKDARLKIRVAGRVQGVGFRPFVARLAWELGVRGRVRNSRFGLEVDASGETQSLETLARRLQEEAPEGARIDSIQREWLVPDGAEGFTVEGSLLGGTIASEIPSDVATCEPCLRELLDPKNRRYRYPFTTCARCGPRDSITEGVPFDRDRTTMVDFSLCGDCQLEFHDHKDRRFHAQTMSCPACGPRLQWTDDAGRVLADGDQALQEAVAHLREGGLLAMKGVGGFQLVASALSEGAVERLREIKHRPSKPLAVLVPDLEEARRLAHVSPQERMLLSSPAAPIVVLFSCGGLPSNVAPGLDSVGLFLPYSPLHHLLVADFGGPLVVTSGNITDEPMPCGNEEALRRLPGCRRFLSHNRRIARSLDDSVAQVVAEHTQLLRRARGYSADSVEAPVEGGTLALGGHLKNTVALTSEGRIWVSPHIGDLDSDLTRERARWEAETLALRAGQKVERIVCDRHPDYGSTHLAEGYDLAREQIQHHEAHAWACAAEHGLRPPWLAVTWDGAGLGDDETLWGGEFWRARDDGKLHRIASLRPFRIPRGAALEPRRSALGILHELETGASEWNGLAGRFLETERLTLKALLSAGEGPMTTSIGRLFDAVGCLLHGRAVCEYEGQAAMELEVLARNGHPRHDLRFEVHFQEAPWRIDWEPMLHQMACRLQEGASTADLAAGFHQALSDVIVRVAHEAGEQIVLLCGGVFQNRLLLQATAEALFGEGFTAIWPRAFPPNDGGLSLGQAMAAARRNHVFGNSR